MGLICQGTRVSTVDVAPAEDKRANAIWSGVLAKSPLPELLAHANNRGFSGSIIFRAPDGQRAMLYCREGRVLQASVPEQDAGLEQTAVAPLLPGDLRRFSAQHAERRGLTLLQAAMQLKLLPQSALEAAHRTLVTSQVRVIAKLHPQTHCQFFVGMDCFGGKPMLAKGVEPLGLIFAALLAEPAAERCLRALQSTQDIGLVAELEPQRAAELTGPLRAVVSRLQRSKDSLNQLKELRVAPLNELVAAIYALRLTKCARLHNDTVTDPRVTSSSGEHIALGATAAESTVRPPRYSTFVPTAPEAAPKTVRPGHRGARGPSGAPSDALTPALGSKMMSRRVVSEATVENKCVEAWLKASDEPRYVERASLIAERAVQLFPENARVQFCRGALLCLEGNLTQARTHLKIALKLEPADGQARAELRRVEEQLELGNRKSFLSRFRDSKAK